jgi:RNA polymerase sigma-70 factor, ECF subfamily
MTVMTTSAEATPISDDSDTNRLVQQAASGDQDAWAALVSRHRGRLKCMVAMRMDRRLQGRIDPSDVVQEACLVASKHIESYASRPNMPFYLWLRWIAGQRLMDQQRRNLGSKAREVNREIALYQGSFPESTCAGLAAQFLDKLDSPSEDAIRIEQSAKLQEALNQLEPIDREILALRHFEQLSNGEAAHLLGLDKSAASKRYARALIRLRDLLLPILGPDF